MEMPFDASELIGSSSDIAKTCFDLPARPREVTAPAGVTSPVVQTISLPLLPTPKPLQTPKRPRDTEVMDTLKEQRVVVLKLPHDTLYQDLTRLFGPYSVKSIDHISRSPDYAIVSLTSAEEASRAIRELSGKLLQGSSISLFSKEHISRVAFIEHGKHAMPLEENRPSKRVRSDQIEEGPIARQHIEHTTCRTESHIGKTSKNHNPKDIEFLIGGLSPEAKAYQVRAFLDSHHITCTSWPQKKIRRDKDLGFYTSIRLLNSEQSRADMRRLTGQYLNGSKIKIRLVEVPVASKDRYTQEPQYQRTEDEAELATQRAIAGGRRVCVSNLKDSTTEDDLRDYFRNYAVEAITMDSVPPLRPSDGYPAFIDFQSVSELNRAHSDLHARQDTGDLLPVHKAAQYLRLRNNRIIFTVWSQEKEDERKTRAPPTREERHLNRTVFTHYTLRIAGLPSDATKTDVKHLFPEIDFKTITLEPSPSTDRPTSYAIAEAIMNVNQERAMTRFKPRKLQDYTVTIAMDTDSKNVPPSEPVSSKRLGLNNDPPGWEIGSRKTTVPAGPGTDKARSDHQALLPNHVAKMRPLDSEHDSNSAINPVLPATAVLVPQNPISPNDASEEAMLDRHEAQALERKTLREWWIRERGIWLDI